MNRRTLASVAGLTLGSLIAMLGPRYLAAGTHSYVGNYSYKKVGTYMYLQAPWQATRGSEVVLRARLYDRYEWEGVRGVYVRFHLGSIVRWARTNGAGRASVRFPADVAPDRYKAWAEFGGNQEYAGSRDSDRIWVRWEAVFRDDLGAGRINMNPSTHEFQFQAANEQTEILVADRMRLVSAGGADLVTLAHDDGEVTVAGEFEMGSEVFTAVVNTDLGTYHLVGAPLVGARALRPVRPAPATGLLPA